MSDQVDAGKLERAGTQEGSVYHPQQHGQAAMPPPVVSGGNTTFTYKMDHRKRGVFVLINNEEFDKEKTGQGVRKGTDIDADKLTERFKELGFEVKRHDNKTYKEMENIMEEAAKENHGDSDCFACAILSHGEDDKLYGTDGTIELNQLVEPFKGNRCPSLLGKPKLFIIQACRGFKFDEGANIEQADSDSIADDEKIPEQKPSKIPIEADIIFAFSSVSGYYSWRNSGKGSWFINALSQILEEYGEREEIVLLLTRTNHKVASEFESSGKNAGNKQIPQIVSMLTKQLYFFPKLPVLQAAEMLENMSTS